VRTDLGGGRKKVSSDRKNQKNKKVISGSNSWGIENRRKKGRSWGFHPVPKTREEGRRRAFYRRWGEKKGDKKYFTLGGADTYREQNTESGPNLKKKKQ